MEDYNELIEAYKEIYYANEGDFNVLNAVHLGENDHTNILCGILNLKVGDNKPFMESFIKKVLNINIECKSLMALTQISAIGSKEDSHGYIDLLIKDKDNKFLIVIENKVCDATDMPHQLDRYYFTFKDESNNTDLLDAYSDKEFINGCQTYWKDRANSKVASEGSNIYIVYLTKDGTKEPSEESINEELKEHLGDKYKEISYRDNISNWLNGGDASNNSIELYRLALNKFLTTKEAKNKEYLKDTAIQSFINEKVFKGENLSLVDQYKTLNTTYDELKKLKTKLDKHSESDLVLNDLVDCVECYRDNVFGQFAPDNWMVYCSPQSITFFPSHWYANYKGSKNSCIHFMIYKWNSKNYQLNLNIHNDACKRYIINKGVDYQSLKKALVINNEWIKGRPQFPDYLQETIAALKNKKPEWHVAYNKQKIVEEIKMEWDPNNNVEVFFKNFVNCDKIQNIVDWIDNNLN